jgi:hydrogenase maturation protease
VEIGTAGLQLVQHLLDDYQRLIIVDAASRGGRPGSVYVLAVHEVPPTTDAGDIHLAVPSRALAMAQGVGRLPDSIFIVGCEPKHVDELTTELSPEVRAGVDRAVREVRRLIDNGLGEAH